METAIIVAIIGALGTVIAAIISRLVKNEQSKKDDTYGNLITRSEHVPIFTPGQSRLTATIVSKTLIVDFSNQQTWSGIALVFQPKLDVRKFTCLSISGVATQQCTFQIEYKANSSGELEMVASASPRSFPVSPHVSTISIPMRFDSLVDEITIMFYETGEASTVTLESIRLSE